MEWNDDLSLYPSYWHSRLKRGFGLGRGKSYLPWLRVRDVPSLGTSGNPRGITVERVYHLLSTPERAYFHIVDRQPDVIDIREQFPILDLRATVSLCAERGVKHPRKGRYFQPFTIDFLITRRTPEGLVYEARSIKTPQDAQDQATRLRLSIEHEWCKRAGIDWKLIDTSSFSTDLLSTLTFIRAWARHRFVPNSSNASAFVDAFHDTYNPNRPLREVIRACSERLKRNYAECLNEFRYCAWSDRLPIEITRKVTLHLPVVLRVNHDHN